MDESQDQYRPKESRNEVQRDEDQFAAFMFGPRRKRAASVQQPVFDYNEFMVNIDLLMDSMQNLKPLFQQVYPKITQLFSKK